MKNGSIGATAVALASLLTCLPAVAVERGFYIGGFYGLTDSDIDEARFADQTTTIYENFAFFPSLSQTSFDAEDSGFGFFGGYRWLRNLAFEGGYVDLGKASYRDVSAGIYDDGTNPPTAENWNQSTSRSLSGITLSALGILPLSYRAELFVRGGVMFSTTEVGVHISDGVGQASGDTSDSDTDFLVGVGGGFTFAEIYTLRLEYQRIFDAGAADSDFSGAGLGEADIDLISLGFTVAF